MTDQELIDCNAPEQQIERLRHIVRRLRAPGGCPWDAEQDHQSLIPNLIEEAYEVVDTIRREDYPHLKEELGDLLLQVVFHAELRAEENDFSLEDSAHEVCEKLIRRHPHVFSTNEIDSTEGVLKQWDEIKKKEKGETGAEPYLHKVGEGLPALLASQKIQKKVSKVGFDWEDTRGVIEKIREELAEVEEALNAKDQKHLEEELGDLLFSVVNLPRKLKLDSDLLLHEANEKFKSRFSQMEKVLMQQKKTLQEASLEEMETAWQSCKSSPAEQ